MIASAKALPKLKKRKLSPKQQSLHNFSFGQSAEKTASEFLVDHGFQILDRNVACDRHEVDIVAIDRTHRELVFVEVKSRINQEFGNPSFAVDRQKLRSMAYVAGAFRRRHPRLLHLPFRFDIIAITSQNIDHFSNVTWIGRR